MEMLEGFFGNQIITICRKIFESLGLCNFGAAQKEVHHPPTWENLKNVG